MPTADLFLRKNETRAVGGVELATGRNANEDVRIEPDSASLEMGGGDGADSSGTVLLKDQSDNPRIQLAGVGGSKQSPSDLRVFVDGEKGRVELGENGTASGDPDITLSPSNGRVTLGGGSGQNSDGELLLAEQTGRPRIHIETSAVGPASGEVNVYATGSRLSAGDRRQATRDTGVTIEGGHGFLNLGADDIDGLLTLFRSQDIAGTFPTVRLEGERGLVQAGGGPAEGRHRGVDGWVLVSNGRNIDVCEIDGSDATMRIGSEGTGPDNLGAENGTIEVVHERGMTTAELKGEAGSVVAGGKNTSGSLLLKHENDAGTVAQYLLEANQNGLVVSTKKTTASGTNVTTDQALRIDPDGTVRVKGGSVKPL